jgi:uncharacterized protein
MNQVKTKKLKRESIRNGEIKIFGTQDGINVVESPIKTKILSLLKNGGLNGSDIVLFTGKSKSTISAHLKDLINQGIVDYKPDSLDGRRKIFFIKSRYLGELSRKMELEKDLDHFLYRQKDSEDPFKFFKYVFRTIRVSLMEEGVNIDPILHNSGIKIGETFYDEFKSPKTDVLIQNMAHFWEKHGLGRMEIEKLIPPTIRIYDCFECEELPKIGRSACVFDSGILQAVFSVHFTREVGVKEIKCYAKGDDYCSFVINKKY